MPQKCRGCGMEIKFGEIHGAGCPYDKTVYPILCHCGIVIWSDSPYHEHCPIKLHPGPRKYFS